MKNDHVNYKEIKKQISLPNFVKDVLGYTETRDSSDRNPKFKSPSGDIIVITRSTEGYDTYFIPQESTANSQNGGKSVIDLLVDHYKKTKGKTITTKESANILLKEYIENNKTIKPDKSEYKVEKKLYDSEYILRSIRDCSKINDDNKFLKNRGINLDILKEKGWTDVFLERKRYNKDKTDRDGRPLYFMNIAVRMYNESGVQAISERNESYKGVEGGKSDSVASSFRVDKNAPIEKVHIFESMIDAVSFYQMNYYDTGLKDKNVIFLSTEGALTLAQIHTIQQVLDKQQIKQVELNFDNDLAGLKYSLAMTNSLSLSGNNSIVNVHLSESRGVGEEKTFFLNVTIDEYSKNKADELMKSLFPREMFENFYDNNKLSFSSGFTQTDGTKQHYSISFPQDKELLKEIIYKFSEFKFDNNLVVNLPQAKDFNDDLKIQLEKNINQQISI